METNCVYCGLLKSCQDITQPGVTTTIRGKRVVTEYICRDCARLKLVQLNRLCQKADETGFWGGNETSLGTS